MGHEGDLCVMTEGAGVNLLSFSACDGIDDEPLGYGINIFLTPEQAVLLGHALIEAGKAKGN